MEELKDVHTERWMFGSENGGVVGVGVQAVVEATRGEVHME